MADRQAENLRRTVSRLLGEVHMNNVREKADEIIAVVRGADFDEFDEYGIRCYGTRDGGAS